MNDRIILDLCGGTGAWSRPYREAGYDVRVITLPEYDVTQHMVNGDYLYFPCVSKDDLRNDINVCISDIYGIFAAPPCTEFSLARTTARTPRDFAAGMRIVRACLDVIWACQQRGKLGFWAMENPRGLLRRFMGRPSYTFEHWEFGDMGIKPTDLWGHFSPPPKKVIDRPDGLSHKYPCGSIMARNWNPRCYPGLKKADMRAITPTGFAQAFFKANR